MFSKAIKISLILCLVSLGTSHLLAQKQLLRFSEDTTEFFKELKGYVENAPNREVEAKKLMKSFEPVWFGGAFTDHQKKLVLKVSNFMLKKKMSPFPFYKNYILALIGFHHSQQSEDSFDAWALNLEKIIKSNNKRKLQSYLEFSSYFFEENAVFRSNSVKWVVEASEYFFEYADVPFIVFPSLNLKCYSKGDSAIIHHTSGVYFPTTNTFKGKTGDLYWQRAGFSQQEVRAELSSYKIDVKKSTFNADSVLFYNTFWFNKPLKGKVIEKVLANVTPENASYPEFISYDQRIKIPNLLDDVDFDGGFTQKGSKIIGSGTPDHKAALFVYRDNAPFITLESEAFLIKPDKIASAKTQTTIYLDEDSITHPDLTLNISSKDKHISLTRVGDGLQKTPYTNTYHKTEMYFDQFSWTIGAPTAYLGPIEGSEISNMLLESNDYYQQANFDRLMGIDAKSPLYVINRCSRDNGDVDELSLKEIANCWGISRAQAKGMLLRLSTLGFVQYNVSNDMITINQKLRHYIYSNAEKEDYDNIQFKSITKEGKINGELNLLSNNIRLSGVDMVLLSDSQKVYVYPKDGNLLLKKNRDFEFTGVVNAGAFELFGKEYKFNYQNFKIEMPQIDSAHTYVTADQTDENGRPIESKVKSTIEDLKGELLIDNPGNKSGIKRLSRYPVFKSKEPSFVYYDAKQILGGVYNRSKFYFQVNPFEYDSLDQITAKSLNFEGTLVSYDIFPDIDEKLGVMNDLSLGFVHNTPSAGLDCYQGKGNYNNEIILSNRGLRGDGELSYLTSIVESNDFIFYPDSMNTMAQNYSIEEVPNGTEFPPVYGQDVQIHWQPYNDFMNASNGKKPIAMYDGSKFEGTLTNKPTGLEGDGMLAFQKAELESNLMKFKFMDFSADTAEFRLKNDIANEDAVAAASAISFATDNVKAHVDFREMKGDFWSNDGGSFVDFPRNKYIAFMDKFTWYMESEDIELSASTKVKDENTGVQLEGAEFISVHENQDSLRFFAGGAIYNVDKNIINCTRIKYIYVADGLVHPDSGKMTIKRNAKIDPLENSTIIANSTNRYHEIFDAKTEILGRYNYRASGKYNYKDGEGKLQEVFFEEIKVDSSKQTIAKGFVEESANFTISPRYDFKGEVELYASKKNLTFDGNGKLKHNCELIPKDWFRFRGELNPKDVLIPIDTVLRNEKKNPVVASVMMKNDSAHLYPRFTSLPKTYSDHELIHASGFLRFNAEKNVFEISNLAKMEELSLPGNYINMNADDCNMYGEGRLNLGVDFGHMKVDPVGNITYYAQADSGIIKTMMSSDFFFSSEALDYMAKTFQANTAGEPIDFDTEVFTHGLQEYVGKKKSDKLITDLSLLGKFKKFPKELEKSLFFTDVQMRWNQETRSYVSIGQLSLSNIKNNVINQKLNGNLEIVKRRSGDIFTLYLEVDAYTWYYFFYTRGILQVLSSDTGFNDIVKNTKNDKRKTKYGKGKTFSYMLSSPKKQKDFVRKMQQILEE